MAETVANIQTGSGKIYKAAVGTSKPTVTGTLGGSITWTGWSTLGYTEGNVNIQLKTTKKEFKPAGSKTKILSKIVQKDASGKFVLAESDADAYAVIVPAAGLTSAVVTDGGDDAAEDYYAMAVETDLMVYFFEKVMFDLDGDVVLQDDDFTKLGVAFEAHKYESGTAGAQIWTFSERTSA